MFINGALQPARRHTTVHDRWTGEAVGSVPRDGAEEAAAAVAALAAGRRAMTPQQRSAVLARAADLLTARAEEFSTLITAESGVCRKETLREVSRAAGNLKVAAAEAERIRGESIPLPDGTRLAVTLPEPIGVVL